MASVPPRSSASQRAGARASPAGREQDRRVERLRWRIVVGARRPTRSPSSSASRCAPGERVNTCTRRAFVQRDLRGEVRGAAEAVDAEPAAGRHRGAGAARGSR